MRIRRLNFSIWFGCVSLESRITSEHTHTPSVLIGYQEIAASQSDDLILLLRYRLSRTEHTGVHVIVLRFSQQRESSAILNFQGKLLGLQLETGFSELYVFCGDTSASQLAPHTHTHTATHHSNPVENI